MIKSRNKKISIFLLILSLCYLYLSFQLPSYPLVPVDADVIPITLGILLLLLSVILFFNNDELPKEKQQSVLPKNKKDLFMVTTVCGFIIVYILLLEPIGFVLTSILFIFLTTLVLGYKKHISNIIVSIAVPVTFYFIFSYLLEISLPKGILPF